MTDFFRDPHDYETLKREALNELLDASDSDTQLRIWVPGCATGEEAYSVAICVAETIAARGEDRQFIVFASDIDEQALENARYGLYPESIASAVSETRLRLFFDAVDHHYRVKRRLRERVVFAVHDVLGDPPYSSLDLVSCRNLLMDLQTDTQQRVLTTFHFALNGSGFLFLGNSETVGEPIDLFEPVVKEQRLFRRIGINRRRPLDRPFRASSYNTQNNRALSSGDATRDVDEIEKIARTILLQEHVPATVLVNRKLEILCSYGPIQDYFKLPMGRTSLELMQMVHESCRSSLRAVTHRAFRDDTRSEVRAKPYDDRTAALRIVARPLQRPDSGRGVLMVTFERANDEAHSASGTQSESNVESQLYVELEDTRHELQSTIQALEAANEDLKSSNEEILSISEDLQSTNEELETSKEELQSVNEELITVNNELETKVKELDTAHDDLYNLCSRTRLATLFLDRALCIKRFTPTIRELLSVIESDVGRPLTDITRKIDDLGLLDDADEVLKDLVSREKEIQSTRNERWYLRRVQPYRTRSDAIEGVVITFTDITDLKRVAIASGESEQQLDLAMSALQGGIWNMALDPTRPSAQPSDRIYISPQLKALLGYRPEQFPDSLAAWRERIVDEDARFHDISNLGKDASYAERRYRVRHRDGGIRWFSSQGRVISDEQGRPVRWIGIDYDITAQKEAADRTQRMQVQLQLLADAIPLLIVYVDRDGIIRMANATWLQTFASTLEDIVGRPLTELLAPDIHDAMRPFIRRALEGYTASNKLHKLTPQSPGRDTAFKVRYVPHTIDDEVLGCYLVAGAMDSGSPSMNQLGPHSGLVYLQRMATVGEFASTLAHDLRQPLSAIKTYAGAVTRMLHANKPVEDTSPYLRKIADQVNHANEIVDKTRDFVGHRDAGTSRIELNTVVNRAIALTDGLTRNLNIEVRLELGSPLPEIDCYAVQIGQVIINLITNACDAMESVERDARTLRLSTSMLDDTHVQLMVADTGEGIPADKIGMIFDTFYTSKLDGMGIGLALSRSIVEDHNGALWVESQSGEGASFYLSLPVEQDDDNEPVEQPTATG